MRKILSSLFLFSTFYIFGQAQDAKLEGISGERSLVIPFVPNARVTIDGNLDEDAWRKAAKTEGFFKVPGSTMAERQTHIWVFYDKTQVYVGFVCDEPFPDKIVSKNREKDDGQLYKDDCVELILAPNNSAEYFHFIANAAGSRYSSRNGKSAWNTASDWTSASKVSSKSWIVEMTIPFALLEQKAPFRGDVWLVKFLREDKASGNSQNEINSSWTCIETGGFDSPLSFGKLVFQDSNMLVNGGMEEDSNGNNLPNAWDNLWIQAQKNEKLQKEARQIEYALDQKEKVSGEASARFTRKEKGGFFGILQQSAMMRKGQSYRLSAKIKISGLTDTNGGAYMGLSCGKQKESMRIPPAEGFNEYSLKLNCAEDGWGTVQFSLWQSPCTVWIDDVRLELAGQGMEPGEVCLTGNYLGENPAGVNFKTGGTYSYYEYGTSQEYFPDGDIAVKGRIPIDGGKLTNGRAEPVQWGNKERTAFDFRIKGRDIEFDFGKDYLITRIQVFPCGTNLSGASVWARPSNGKKFCMVGDIQASKGTPSGYTEFTGLDTPARYVRINVRHLAVGQTGLQQIKIYGKNEISAKAGKTTSVIPKALDISSEAVPDLNLLAGMPAIPLYPLPVETVFGKGKISLDKPTLFYSGPEAMEQMINAFRDDALCYWDFSVRIKRDERLKNACALFISSGLGPAPETVSNAITLAKDAQGLADEAYLIQVNASSALVAGKDINGLFYGLQTLLQLLNRDEQRQWQLPEVSIKDYPQYPYRMIWHNAKISGKWEQKRIRSHAFLKFNYANGLLDFREGGDGDVTCRFADSRSYKIIPTLAMTPNPCFYDSGAILKESERNQVFECFPGETYAEIRKKTNGTRMNFCPSNPRSWEGLCHIWKVNAGRYNSPFVLTGTDEMYQTSSGSRWNACNLCKARNMTNGELLLDAMLRADKELKTMGKTPFWFSTLYGHSSFEPDDKNSLSWPFERLPKNNLCQTYLRRLSAKLHKMGYRQIGGLAVCDEIPFAELKPETPLYGTVIWNWGSDAENVLASEGTLLGYAAQAEQNWSAFGNKPPVYSAEFYRRTIMGLGLLRRYLKGTAYPSEISGKKTYTPIDLSKYCNRSFSNSNSTDGGWLDMGPGLDISSFPTGKIKVGEISFEISAGNKNCILLEGRGIMDRTLPWRVRGIGVGRKLDSIVFLHTVNDVSDNNYARQANLAGIYLIRYEDGTYVRTDMRMGSNVAEWTKDFGSDPAAAPWKAILYDAKCAWAGRTRSGKVASVYAYEWTNPYPEKVIASFDFQAPWKKTHLKPILIAATGINNSNYFPGKALPENFPLRAYINTPDECTGRRMEFKGGVLDKSGKIYTAPDGTTISVSDVSSIMKREASELINLFEDGNQRWSSQKDASVTVNFSKPVPVSSLRLTGILEFDRYPGAQHIDGIIETTVDGKNWENAGSFEKYSGDEGPRIFDLKGKTLQSLRVRFTGTPSGLSGLDLFAP